ncbi:hypothetical protein CEXT_4581 [Caerostris extrusa]|uniref:Uncharacterized protein n=1 Tax=Caerostris extrusa TaxID=172846 RepID=A0AAV4TX30_CAEEX|nr:hypothetical protein CEXT_4581 [Caerostris extrusa]
MKGQYNSSGITDRFSPLLFSARYKTLGFFHLMRPYIRTTRLWDAALAFPADYYKASWADLSVPLQRNYSAMTKEVFCCNQQKISFHGRERRK